MLGNKWPNIMHIPKVAIIVKTQGQDVMKMAIRSPVDPSVSK
jgi:hypothetical protein